MNNVRNNIWLKWADQNVDQLAKRSLDRAPDFMSWWNTRTNPADIIRTAITAELVVKDTIGD